MPEISTADIMTLDWLTLTECAVDIDVKREQVRQFCIRWREGKSGGLKYSHFGAKPEDETERTMYRVHRDDWEAFKRERRREQQKEDRRISRLCVSPIDYGGTREAGVGGRGR